MSEPKPAYAQPHTDELARHGQTQPTNQGGQPIYVYPAANGNRWHIAHSELEHNRSVTTRCGRKIRAIATWHGPLLPDQRVCAQCERQARGDAKR